VRALAEASLGPVGQLDKLTLTLGVAQYRSSIDACIKAADAALYAGKQAGRNRVAVAGVEGPAHEAVAQR